MVAISLMISSGIHPLALTSSSAVFESAPLARGRRQENVYPKGPSVQFYKLYLDSNVRRQLIEYDALAIIEWDVIVAHDTSFEKLYAAAFGGVEPFWIKGSTLEGVNFHETVVLAESRHVLGHINGNAIYNNTDPAFVEFVNYTLTRWEYTQSYDVALWATISDFPYSWPLWQRYSRKFVAIDLIANVGFQDMDQQAVLKAVASDTLFIHGSLTGGGGSMFHASGAKADSSPAFRFLGKNRPGERCTASCGGEAPPSSGGGAGALGTVCDRSCYSGGELGARFGGYLCGAGDAKEYGSHCRTCFTDLEEAQAAEERLAEEEQAAMRGRSFKMPGDKEKGRRVLRADDGPEGAAGWVEGEGGGDSRAVLRGSRGGGAGVTRRTDAVYGGTDDEIVERRRHVIMCDTLMPPPPATGCSNKCQMKTDTVCDRSCGTGRYGDYNCGWRGYGSDCRFCFNDREEALTANAVAKRRGGSVIMCHTFEPPTEEDEWTPPITAEDDDGTIGGGHGAAAAAAAAGAEDAAAPKVLTSSSTDDDTPYDPANEPYLKDITRGQICAFMTGFSSFLKETEVTVKSIVQFMPGMRVAIATQDHDVSVFERSLGNLPGVVVSEAISPITLAPLLADRHCGKGTKLVFYMNPGELLSRKFTSKDTHSAAGDLLVVYAEVGRVGEASIRRALATMSVLGFSSPSFSFGMDIMLPVHTNGQLRELLLSDPGATGKGLDRESQAVHALGKYSGVFVPEVLAALAYSLNEPGLWFINPQQWVTHHMFQQASIWDIPLVKPRFGCAFDISMAAQGYDVASALETQLGHFMSGSACERGFIPLDHASLRPKPNIEFGYPTGREMPSISKLRLRVSVIFCVGRGVSPTLLDASILSVEAKFPDAAEVVVVFTEPPAKRAALREILKVRSESAPFPVEAIEEDGPIGAPTDGGWPGWSGLRADDYASGDLVMMLDAGDLLVIDVTYDNIFHFGKPVIPFKRLALGNGGGSGGWASTDSLTDKYIACAIESVIEMEVVRDFALVRGLVYPTSAFTEMRIFAGEVHNVDIDYLVGQAHDNCRRVVRNNGAPVGASVHRGTFEASLLGSFMWRFMPDSVHWRALDPLDVQPDEWMSDVGKYNLLCPLGHLDVPKDNRGARELANRLKGIDSRGACDQFLRHVRLSR
ncbi:expressed unknown protein [Ectocarpus siliculosus]|uniref:Uncharacterized protein n=1 Tax=Ectocarpus siliculosus TaxID=2880 RepID=D8LU84_ECTSI|nr:expressed unknown protein [Ectocarpus siliculosus]|eukprot:CBN75425.1 expressed unknown protein [Ectocarpus siliculosus]